MCFEMYVFPIVETLLLEEEIEEELEEELEED